MGRGGLSLGMEGELMFGYLFHPRLSEFDLQVFDAFVSRDHFLRRALAVIPWGDFDGLLAKYYSPDKGRPPEPPSLMLKLQYLCYHCRLRRTGRPIAIGRNLLSVASWLTRS